MKNINTSDKITNIINLKNKVCYLKIIKNLNVYIPSIIYEFYCRFINEINLFNIYKNITLKIINIYSDKFILNKLNLKYILKFIFKFYNNNIYENKVLQIIKINNIIYILKTLYNNNKNNIKSIIILLNHYINKINLYNLFKNKILKIMNIYGNKLTLTEFNYYSLQLNLLKSEILNFESNLKDHIIDYLNLKIYRYLLLLLLYLSSLTIPLALIAFP